MGTWRRHFFYRKKSIRMTWRLRLATLLVATITLTLTRGFWIAQIGRSLVCTGEMAASDVIVVENFDPTYVVFERAAALQKAGLAPKVLVPVEVSRDPGDPNPVSKGIAEVMARQARIGVWEIVPLREAEPISLNATAQIRDYLNREHVSSIIIVTPGFRSRRSSLVYGAVLNNSGTRVYCVPVFGSHTLGNWAHTWHGMQVVTEEFLKLQYYRFYVLPFGASRLG
jgi:hypothetical protein